MSILGASHPHDTWPSWKPDVHPTYTPESLRTHLQKRSKCEPPDSGTEFCLYHPDLHPANIFIKVSKDCAQPVRISAIIDWEDAGYWPRFWFVTCPKVSRWFLVEGENEFAWRDKLCSHIQLQLGKEKFTDESSWWESQDA